MNANNVLVAALITLLGANAQAQGAPNSTAMPMSSKAAASAAMPLVLGEVRKVDLTKGLIVLRHRDIPNLAMPGMTMGFDVADKKLLDGLNAGDHVEFQAEMIKGKATVTELKRR
ncbi:metal transporter [Roseateles aquatilis]|uniref:Metal transporter n=1 Tax=Roseateles aquatilis TaxID=431061 RepID=A0A246JFV9_9BURK|nr:copper-binding protein [Roseateles aquatilis]OWQ91453.1 metal transporter [Roseateles aquatilis]